MSTMSAEERLRWVNIVQRYFAERKVEHPGRKLTPVEVREIVLWAEENGLRHWDEDEAHSRHVSEWVRQCSDAINGHKTPDPDGILIREFFTAPMEVRDPRGGGAKSGGGEDSDEVEGGPMGGRERPRIVNKVLPRDERNWSFLTASQAAKWQGILNDCLALRTENESLNKHYRPARAKHIVMSFDFDSHMGEQDSAS